MKITFFLIAAFVIGQAQASPTPPAPSPSLETYSNCSITMDPNNPDSTQETLIRNRRTSIFSNPWKRLEVETRNDNESVTFCWTNLQQGYWGVCNYLPEMETILDPDTLIDVSTLSKREAKRRGKLFSRLQSHESCQNMSQQSTTEMARLCIRFHRKLVSDCLFVSGESTFCQTLNQTAHQMETTPAVSLLSAWFGNQEFLLATYKSILLRLNSLKQLVKDCYHEQVAYKQTDKCRRISWDRRTQPWTRLEAFAVNEFDKLLQAKPTQGPLPQLVSNGMPDDFELHFPDGI